MGDFNESFEVTKKYFARWNYHIAEPQYTNFYSIKGRRNTHLDHIGTTELPGPLKMIETEIDSDHMMIETTIEYEDIGPARFTEKIEHYVKDNTDRDLIVRLINDKDFP
jgi:hypothetical protein